MDKRPAGLVIAAAVTVVGIAWASAQEHKPTRLPPVPLGALEPQRSFHWFYLGLLAGSIRTGTTSHS